MALFKNRRLSLLPLLALAAILLVFTILITPATGIKIDQKASNYQNWHKAAQLARAHAPPPVPDTDPPVFKDSAEEDLYYFFSLHDFNKDHHLDGHELWNAFSSAGELPPKDQRLTVADLEEYVDHALKDDDIDNDGLVSWEEYLASQLYHDN
ncbi:hypothetical protein HDU86_003407 [Geranomyces michiganensis]|nr:hypothetical protein HDU86_003407 [Geranomyces michiganensis]